MGQEPSQPLYQWLGGPVQGLGAIAQSLYMLYKLCTITQRTTQIDIVTLHPIKVMLNISVLLGEPHNATINMTTYPAILPHTSLPACMPACVLLHILVLLLYRVCY